MAEYLNFVDNLKKKEKVTMLLSKKHRLNLGLVVFLVGSLMLSYQPHTQAADDSQFFSETGFTVSGKFLTYWKANGGLATYGYPITAAQNEVDPETGKTFLTQWFERNRFELHPENAGSKYEVLLGLLGKDLRREALNIDADFAAVQAINDPSFSKDEQTYFAETKHNVRLDFLAYWKANGGLERFGFPISEELASVDPETGKVFMTQWFERARFEAHLENKPPYTVLLGLLGKQLKSPKPEFAWKTALGANQSQPSTALTVDKFGNVYTLSNANAMFSTNTYPIQKFSPSGDLLMQWTNSTVVADQIRYANDIAVDNQGNVYVAENANIFKYNKNRNLIAKYTSDKGTYVSVASDSQDNIYAVYVADKKEYVRKYSPNGTVLFEIGGETGSGDGQFIYVKNIAVDREDNFYVVDRTNWRVQKFDKNGKFLLKWGRNGTADGEFQLIDGGISTDSQNNVYVFDTGNKRVQKFDKNGTFLLKWTIAGDDFIKLNANPGLEVDNRDNVYVNNGKSIQKFDSAGRPMPPWNFRVTVTYQPLINPSITADGAGNFYLASGSELHRHDKAGKLTGKWQVSGTNTIADLAASDDGNVFVLDNLNNQVQKIDNNGKFLLKWGSEGIGNAQFSQATNIAVDAQGNVYVLDHEGKRIQKFDNSGRYLLSWKTNENPNSTATDLQIAGAFVYTFNYIHFENTSNSGRIIIKFDTTGNKVEELYGGGTESDFGVSIDGFTVDKAGNIYSKVHCTSTTTNPAIVGKINSAREVVFQIKCGRASGQAPFVINDMIVDRQNNLYLVGDDSQVYKFRQP